MTWRFKSPTVTGFLNRASRFDGDDLQLKVSGSNPFGEVDVAEKQSIIGLQSTWGLSYERDVQASSGTGTAVASRGSIYLQTGVTSGGYHRLETAEYGRYAPGRAAQYGIGVRINSAPAGSIFRWGIGLQGQNALFWEYTPENGTVIALSKAGTVIRSVNVVSAEYSVNANTPIDFLDPTSQGIIYGATFTWYGYGNVTPKAWIAVNTTKNHDLHDLTEVAIEDFIVTGETSLTDPNMPVFAEIEGAAGAEMEIGGRRYDVVGKYTPPYRERGATRLSQFTDASSAMVAPIAFRRKANFPHTDQDNTITSYLAGFEAFADVDCELMFFSNGEVGGTWVVPTYTSSTETILEMNTGITSVNLNSAQLRAGPFAIHASQDNKAAFGTITDDRGFRVPLIRNDSLIMVVKPIAANTIEYDVGMRILEEW